MLTVFFTLSVIVNVLFLITFGPPTYRFLRDEYAGGFPWDFPVWLYRLRRWWISRADAIGGVLLVLIVLCLLAATLIVTCPDQP